MRLCVLLFISFLCSQSVLAVDDITTELFKDGFNFPVDVEFVPNDAQQRVFVVEQAGRIKLIKNGVVQATPFLDLTKSTLPEHLKVRFQGELGLLGMAVHPNFTSNGYVYINFNTREEVLPGLKKFFSTVMRFQVGVNPDQLDINSALELIKFQQKEWNHNGGWIDFGPHDGYLYTCFGDGGGNVTINGADAQDPSNFFGAIVRIDVNGSANGKPYRIPNDNPGFAAPEVWAYGLRNPWRCSFDKLNGDVYIGDVGWGSREEINRIDSGTSGQNFGWPIWEGDRITEETKLPTVLKEVDPHSGAFTPPIRVLHSSNVKVAIGGYRYRGSLLPDYYGKYFYADFKLYKMYVMSLSGDGSVIGSSDEDLTALLNPAGRVSSFAEDPDGELYIVDYDNGAIHKIIAAGEPVGVAPSMAPIADQESYINSPFSLDINAGGTPQPSFTLTTNPSGMSIDPTTGIITWIPSVAGTFNVTVQASNGVLPHASQSFQITVHDLIPAETGLGTLAQGIDYIYFENDSTPWAQLPDYASMTAKKSGTQSIFDLSQRDRDTHYGLRLEGYIDFPTDGPVTFYLSSDDGARLYVHGIEVVDNDGVHGGQTRTGVLGLRAGMHFIRIDYMQGTGGQNLKLEVQGNGYTRVEVPMSVLWRPSNPQAIPERHAVNPYLNMPTTESGDIPALLSQTGAFSDVQNLVPSTGIIPYTVNSPLWSDGAYKKRWLAVPSGQHVNYDAQQQWILPAGSVTIKHFELGTERRRVETRLLVTKADGTNYGVTYRWRADHSDAELLTDGLSETINYDSTSLTWSYPSPNDCLQCHNAGSGWTLGLNTRQLNGDYIYPATQRASNQIRALSDVGIFTELITDAEINTLDRLAKVDAASESLEHRVRSYLDVNCAMCHTGTSPGIMDFRFNTPLASQNIISASIGDNLGIANAKVVDPGRPERSILLHRMDSLTPGIRMPYIASSKKDLAAINTVTEWINSLPAEPESSPGGTLTLKGPEEIEDTTVCFINNENVTKGHYDYLYYGTLNNGRISRVLIKAPNLQSLLPSNISITNARLRLRLQSGNRNISIQAHKMLLSWDEGAANGLQRLADGTAWPGDWTDVYDDTVIGSELIPLAKGVWTDLDVTSAVQDWVNGDSNHGLFIYLNKAGAANSTESSTVAYHPELIIEYGDAEPVNKAPEITLPATATLQLPDNQLRLNPVISDDQTELVDLTIQWTQISGSEVTFAPDNQSAAPTITFPVAGDYELELRVHDGELATTSTITISVQELIEPTTVTLKGPTYIEDVSVSTLNQGSKRGTWDYMYFGRLNSGDERSAFVKIPNVGAAVPEGMVIDKAYLRIRFISGNKNVEINLYETLLSWEENQVNAIQRLGDGTVWSAAAWSGIVHAADPFLTYTMPTMKGGEWSDLDISEITQRWVDGEANRGVYIKTNKACSGFSTENGNPDNHPELVLELIPTAVTAK